MAGYSCAQELVRRYKIPEPVVLLNTPLYREYKPSTLYRDNLKIPAGQKILLYAGIINNYRGIEEMIQSLKYLPDCCLVLHGFGPNYYISSLHSLIDNNGVRDRVYFFGPVPFDEVSTYAMSADVGLILHKNVGLNYYYVSPNKLFECMAAGLPVVGSNFPDLKRFIEGYMFGVTCNPDSPQEIAKAVEYILADNGRYEMMRRNALQAAKVLNWENESRKLVAIYDNLAKQGGG
jgi:glycosyltransferase involved in cell wall biosynthesis